MTKYRLTTRNHHRHFQLNIGQIEGKHDIKLLKMANTNLDRSSSM